MKTIIDSRQFQMSVNPMRVNAATRSTSKSPVVGQSKKGSYLIFLSADGQEIERVAGFEMGEGRTLVKTLNPREMLEWIQTALDPREKARIDEPTLVEFGRLTIDRAAHRVWVDGDEVILTALEFKLLMKLHDTRNKVMTREMLLDEVWDIHADITTRTVDTFVTRLRNKLKGARQYVQTVRAVGYRFIRAPEEVPG